jgi:hypothetical protein
VTEALRDELAAHGTVEVRKSCLWLLSVGPTCAPDIPLRTPPTNFPCRPINTMNA